MAVTLAASATLRFGGPYDPSLRSVVPCLGLACLSLALGLVAPDAQAGSYSGPVYSGSGNSIVNVNNVPTSSPYTQSGSGWGGGSGGVPNASCSGTIIATLTWQPASANDPPPTQVVVVETCTASTTVQIPGGGSSPTTPQLEARMAKINDLLQAGTEDLRLKNFAAAETDYRDLVQVDQRGTLGPSPYYGLGEALAGQGKVADALAVYKKAVYWPLNFSPEAIAASQAIENKPNLCGCCCGTDAVAWMKYALLLSQTGQTVEAFSVYSQAMHHVSDINSSRIVLFSNTTPPSPSALQAAMHIAIGLLTGGMLVEPEIALSEFDQALRLAPDAPVTNYYYGYGWQRLDLNDKMKVVDAPQAKATLTKAASAEDSNINKAAAEVLKRMP